LEAGFTPGDKLVLYADQTYTAESLVTQMGAIKAGVSVVTFDEKDDCEAFDHALATSKARGLVFSPSTQTDEENTTR
jgi:long-subunit acyl-CoA synthetase (AMP-forming)